MNVNKNDKICEVPLIKIRNFLRRFNSDYYENISKSLSDYFGLSDKAAEALLSELISNGYLEKEEKDKDIYQRSVKGNALSNVRFVKRMNKQKADRVFEDFMARVESLNKSDDFIYKVKRILLFGSYLNKENEDFGDIDLAVELEQRIKDNKAFEDAQQEIINNAIENGKVFSNIVDELFYPEYLVFKFLKNSSRYISLHRIDQVSMLKITYRQVYPSTDSE